MAQTSPASKSASKIEISSAGISHATTRFHSIVVARSAASIPASGPSPGKRSWNPQVTPGFRSTRVAHQRHLPANASNLVGYPPGERLVAYFHQGFISTHSAAAATHQNPTGSVRQAKGQITRMVTSLFTGVKELRNNYLLFCFILMLVMPAFAAPPDTMESNHVTTEYGLIRKTGRLVRTVVTPPLMRCLQRAQQTL